MPAHFIEVETRYKVHDIDGTLERLGDQGIVVTAKSHLIDQWFAPKTVRTMAQEEQWFDHDHGIAWRVRRTEQPNGSFAVKVESKQLTADNNHNTFKETTMPITDYQAALAAMEDIHYRCWLTIDKTRYDFDGGGDDIEIVLDAIVGMGQAIGVPAGLELEFKGAATRQAALAKLDTFAASIGLDPKDKFAKSFTVESMQALANFKD